MSAARILVGRNRASQPSQRSQARKSFREKIRYIFASRLIVRLSRLATLAIAISTPSGLSDGLSEPSIGARQNDSRSLRDAQAQGRLSSDSRSAFDALKRSRSDRP